MATIGFTGLGSAGSRPARGDAARRRPAVSDLPLFEVPTADDPGDAASDACGVRRGAQDADRVRRALGALVRAVHHVGATSLPGSSGSAVLDLLAEVETLERLVQARLRLLAHGFEPVAVAEVQHHVPDCRLYVVDDMLTGGRRVELRCYPAGHPEAERAPALYALLRARPELARAYLAHKGAARATHGSDEVAYFAAKQEWLERVLDEALALWRRAR